MAPSPALVVVTLDPWRDVPARLPHLARHWGLEVGDRVLSGEVEEVRRVLAAWRVGYARDPSTGEVSHLPLTYVVDAAGRRARATGGTVGELVAALGTD